MPAPASPWLRLQAVSGAEMEPEKLFESLVGTTVTVFWSLGQEGQNTTGTVDGCDGTWLRLSHVRRGREKPAHTWIRLSAVSGFTEE